MSNSNLERSKIEKGGKRLCIFTKKKREREKDCVYLPNQGIKWYNGKEKEKKIKNIEKGDEEE